MNVKKCKNCWIEDRKKDSYFCSYRCREIYETEKKREKKEKEHGKVPYLAKKADSLWSEWIRKRDKECQVCFKNNNLNAHHIFGRTNSATRWDEENGICLCAGCHTFSIKMSAHKTPTDFTFFLESKMGRNKLEELSKKAHLVFELTPEYLKERIIYFNNIINNEK